MKILIFFALAVVFGLVHSDQECFRAVFKECSGEPVQQERMKLCDEIKYKMECLYRKAYECKMSFWVDALDVKSGIDTACVVKNHFDQEKDCYIRSMTDSVCVAPIKETMREHKTDEDFIRAHKKVCNSLDTYFNCVQENVKKNCHKTVLAQVLFNNIFTPYRGLSNSLCEQLILPADEKDSSPDNFGHINVLANLAAIFSSG